MTRFAVIAHYGEVRVPELVSGEPDAIKARYDEDVIGRVWEADTRPNPLVYLGHGLRFSLLMANGMQFWAMYGYPEPPDSYYEYEMKWWGGQHE